MYFRACYEASPAGLVQEQWQDAGTIVKKWLLIAENSVKKVGYSVNSSYILYKRKAGTVTLV